MVDKIQRQVHFILAQIFDSGDTTGDNNTFVYNRAPDGYLFQLIKIQMSPKQEAEYSGIFAVYDGHEYTHWNIWPGVQSMETLFTGNTTGSEVNLVGDLLGWECKEYTIGIRSASATNPYKVCAIMWYFLKKASRIELLEYAVKHPRNQDMFRHSLRGTTVEPTED